MNAAHTVLGGPLRAVAGSLPGPIVRVDLRRDGTAFLHVDAPEAPAWYRWDGGPAVTLVEPHQDRSLPITERWEQLRTEADVDVLAWRPGRRIVLRVAGPTAVVVRKGLRRKRVAAAAGRHQAAAAALADSPVGAPDLIAVDEDDATLVMAIVDGVHPDLGPHGDEVFFRLGAALRRLQAARPWPGASHHGIEEELAVLDTLHASLVGVGLVVPTGWEALRARLEPAEHLVSAPRLPAHRDLHDRQLLVGDDALTLLDFDLLCLADPLLDAANLIAHLKLRELQGLSGADEGSVDRCGRALLDGLDREEDPHYRRRLRFYQATTLLRLALVYTLRPRWAHLARELLDVARRSLREV